MRTATSTRLRFTSLLVLALVGTWLGHGVEYGLVAGWHGVALGFWGPLHSYMLPAALLLAAATFVLALRVAAFAGAAQRRADRLLRSLRRGVPYELPSGPRAAQRIDPRPFVLVIGVAATQILLYLVQENVEATLAGAQAPGLGAIAGAHWTAALVQLAFAAWLTLGWLVCHRILRRRDQTVARLESVIRAIARRRQRPEVRVPASAVVLASPWFSAPSAARAPPGLSAA